MICDSFAVEDNIADLTFLVIGEDADPVRLVSLIILEGLVGDGLGLDSDGLPMQDFLVLVFWFKAYSDTGHDIAQVIVLI